MWCSALDGNGWHCQSTALHCTPHSSLRFELAPHSISPLFSLSVSLWLHCAGPDTPGPDYLSHNSTYYFPWLLQQINAYKREYGVCLLDVLDFHFYPYLNGADSDADPVIQAQLLDQPRGLYDTSFVDPAGNFNPVTAARGPAIIRQVHDWLRAYAPDCPDIGIAITEYAFGGAKLHTTALALAEALSIMAREQLSLATLFQIPTPDTAIFHSFELYNFNSSRVTGDSVRADSSAAVQLLTAYAQHDSDSSVLYVKLFNKDNVTAVAVDVTVLGGSWPNGGSVPTVADAWQLQAAVDQPVGVSVLPPLKVRSNSTALFVRVECAPRTATVLRVAGVTLSTSHARTGASARQQEAAAQ